MKFRNIILYSLLALPFMACDSIDENDRFSGPIEFQTKKNVLIEDFTGQKCVNCPYAAEAIHSMQNIYGAEHVIAVAIHGGPLSVTGGAYGLANDESKEYVSHWGVETFPAGKIDRNTPGTINYTDWSAALVKQLQLTTPVDIEVECDFNQSSRELKIKTSVKSDTEYTGKLQLWVIEDSIKGIQVIPPDGTTSRTYIHNHVFRKTVNGQWGEDFSIKEAGSKDFENSVKIEDAWAAKNVSIVAFVYDSEVRQTIIKKILK